MANVWQQGYVTQREDLFIDLKRRIRDMRQGPDGWIYLVTDASNAEIFRLELT